MSTAGGPDIPKLNSAAVILDPSNFKGTSFARDQNMLDYSTWQLNGTSATGFGRNGSEAENAIISGTGPFGETTLLWETRCDSVSGADGGWNGSYYSVDSTKTYRLSIWVKGTSSTSSGTFYLGTNGGGACVQKLSDFTGQCNPYWECRGVSGYTQNVWYLVVGHVFPYTYSSSTGHPDSGRYTIADGKVSSNNGCNVGQDMRMAQGTTSLRHRTYHYYSTDNTVRLQLAYPRMDLVDGTEPSIEQLLGGSSRNIKNKINRSQQFFIANNARIRKYSSLPTERNYAVDLDGTNDYIDLGSDTTYKTTGGWTVETVVKYDSVPGTYNNTTSPGNFIGSDSITYNSWYWSVLTGKLALWNRSPGIWKYGSTTLQANTWYHTTLVCQPSGTSYQMYLNGIAEGGDHTTYSWNSSYAGLRIRYIGRGNSSNVRQINGQIGYFKVTTEAMSNEEVYNSFNSIRRRFSL